MVPLVAGAGEEIGGVAVLGRGRGRGPSVASAGSSTGAISICQALARITTSPSTASSASTRRTRRPGRTILVTTCSGAIATGRRISKLMRPTWKRLDSGSSSIARARSAEGGPACWAPGSQGPRVSGVESSWPPAVS